MTAKLLSEGLGTALLLIAVVGSGIMGEALASGNVAITLLANAIATGCMLYVLITTLAPVSGAHFNPAVTLAFALRGDIPPGQAMQFVIVQVIGGLLGVWVTVIFGGLKSRAEAVPTLVALYITGAYWYTSSTSFANPAVTIARGFSDSFAGIYPGHIAMFIVMQMIAVGLAAFVLPKLFR